MKGEWRNKKANCEICGREVTAARLNAHIRQSHSFRVNSWPKKEEVTSNEFPLFSLVNGESHFRFAETPYGYIVIEAKQIRIFPKGNLSELLKTKKEKPEESLT